MNNNEKQTEFSSSGTGISLTNKSSRKLEMRIPAIDDLHNLVVEKYATKEKLDESFEKIHSMFQSIINMNIYKSGENIRFVDEPTTRQYMMAIRDNGMNIQYINKPTIEMWDIAVDNEPLSLQFLNSEGLASDYSIFKLFEKAISKNPKAIKYAYEHFKTDISLYEHLCELAFEQDPNCFKYFHNPPLKMIYMAIKHIPSYVTLLRDSRFNNSEYDLISRQMYAIKQNPEAIRYMNQTYELCMETVKNSGMILEYISSEYKTEEICFEAVNKCYLAIEYVPSESLSYRICVKALDTYDDSIREIFYKDCKDPEVYSYFIKNCMNSQWKRLKKYTKKISLKISFMSMLKSLGFWKVTTKIRDVDN